jgi:hypothetical protein
LMSLGLAILRGTSGGRPDMTLRTPLTNSESVGRASALPETCPSPTPPDVRLNLTLAAADADLPS